MTSFDIILTTAHIEVVEGLSTRSAQRRMCTIIKFYNKEKHQFISLEEYQRYTGLSRAFIIARLRDAKMI